MPFVSHVLACVIVAGVQQPGGTDAVEEVLAAYGAACEAVPDYDIEYTTRFVKLLDRQVHNEKPSAQDPRDSKASKATWVSRTPEQQRPIAPWQMRQYYSKGRFRLEPAMVMGATIPKGSLVSTWNASEYMAFEAVESTGNVASLADTVSDANGFCYTNLWKAISPHLTYVEFVRVRIPFGVSLKKENGKFVLSAPPVPQELVDFNKFGVRLELDPDRNFMPSSIDIVQYFDNTRTADLFMRYENQLAEVRPNLWLPVASRAVNYQWSDPDSTFYGEEVAYQSITVNLDRSQFDAVHSDELFEIAFPQGTDVWDEVRQIRYIVGAEQSAEHLNWLARRGRLGSQRLAESKAPFRSVSFIEPSRFRMLLVFANVLLVLAIAIVIILRSRRASA